MMAALTIDAFGRVQLLGQIPRAAADEGKHRSDGMGAMMSDLRRIGRFYSLLPELATCLRFSDSPRNVSSTFRMSGGSGERNVIQTPVIG